MRMLIMHCKEFQAVNSKTAEKQNRGDSVVAMFSVEENDSPGSIQRAIKEIKKASLEHKQSSIVLFPFAHLSNKLASPEKAKEFAEKINEGLQSFEVIQTPFGISKEILLHIYGHQGNVKYREFQ